MRSRRTPFTSFTPTSGHPLGGASGREAEAFKRLDSHHLDAAAAGRTSRQMTLAVVLAAVTTLSFFVLATMLLVGLLVA